MHPNDFPSKRPLFTSLNDLERCLGLAAKQALHQLTDVLLIPQDIPRLPIVLALVCNAVKAYGTSLRAPNKLFHLIHSVVEDLRADVIDRLGWTTSNNELAQPLLKRQLPHTPYALCLSAGMLTTDRATRYMIAIGAEIALSLATGKAFGGSFANEMRREITPHLFGRVNHADNPAKWEKTAARKLQLAAKLFEVDGSPDPSTTEPLRLFDLKAGFELSRKLRYSPPRQRQALLDRHHQCEWQLLASASQLYVRAQAGDQTALLTLIAFVAGLSLATTKDMPIGTALADDEFVMLLNLDDGTIQTNLGRLTPAAAKPLPNATIFRAATWIAVKPLPVFLVELLRRLAEGLPGATSLADLLPEASTSGRQLTLTDDHSALKATTARFLASAGPFAVGLGIDRLSAALLCNDFAVIPGSKLYYALSGRQPIWDAASRLFGALGWGSAVPFVPGSPVGSHIVPSRDAVTEWLAWMAEDVKRLSPGRHCGIIRLLAHHNAYACLCASVTVWLVAAREAKEFHFTTYSLAPAASFASLVDKWVGIFPGEMWVPLCTPLREQLALWLAHCSAFERRLKKLGIPPEHPLMAMLERFIGGESVPMFFRVDLKTYHPQTLGSADLTRWWPESLRFTSDFGRHFWETELRMAAVPSSRIDLLMRHITQAVESHCSINADALINVADDISTAQSELLKQLGYKSIPGLTSRHKEAP
jgi:hypothetical protein